MRAGGGEFCVMDWEAYLTTAVGSVSDKYQARRYKAHFRAQLLEGHQKFIEKGQSSTEAMVMAMVTLGDPEHLAERVSAPITHQRGWLWLLSLAQLVIGISIVAFSWRTESFAAMALGRIMALWGGVSTGFQAHRTRGIRVHLRMLQWRLGSARWGPKIRDVQKMTAVGFLTGILVALVSSLPWNVVTANMFHPVLLSTGSSLMLSALVVVWPWILVRRWLGPSFYVVTLQAWAALGGSAGATALILWHQGFAPPPLFNWQPEMLLAGGWVFNFMLLRLVTAMITFRERVLVGFDEDHFPSF